MAKVYTSRWTNPELAGDHYYTVGICLGMPKFKLKFVESEHCYRLAPDKSMWGKSHEEFARLYRRKLEYIGRETVRRMIRGFLERAEGKDVVLLCYEDVRDPEQNCHRTVLGDWYHEKFGVSICELPDPSPVKYKTPKRAEKKEEAPVFDQMSLFG